MTQPLNTLLNRRMAEIKSAHIGLDAFVLLWVETKGRDVQGLTECGEFSSYPSLSAVKIMTADEAVKESIRYDQVNDRRKTSMGLILHAKCYRDILLRKVEEDIERIDEILTAYDKEEFETAN